MLAQTSAGKAIGLGWSKETQRAVRNFFANKGVFDVEHLLEPGKKSFIKKIKEFDEAGNLVQTFSKKIFPSKWKNYIQQSFGHAEVQALLKAVQDIKKSGGKLPKKLIIVGDRAPCGFCRFTLWRLKEYLGLEELVLLYKTSPDSSTLRRMHL
jgi:cytidine deaminase